MKIQEIQYVNTHNLAKVLKYNSLYLWCQLRNCEKYSKSRDPVGRQPSGLLQRGFGLRRAEESLDFGPGGRTARTADTAALDAGDRRAEA